MVNKNIENISFSEKNIENENEKQFLEKNTKITFDYDQLYIKFRLGFNDGFLFGLGMATAFVIFSIILTMLGIILTMLGFSFINFLLDDFNKVLLKGLM